MVLFQKKNYIFAYIYGYWQMRKLFIRFLWIALVSIVGISLMAFSAIWNGWVGYMPEMADIMNPLDR